MEFECEFALTIAENFGYDILDDTTLETVQHILKSDPSIMELYGYCSYIEYIDKDEIVDVCKKIYFYESNGIDIKDYIYLKTFQRSIVIQKNLKSMSREIYLKYKKYHKNFEYIINWINKQV